MQIPFTFSTSATATGEPGLRVRIESPLTALLGSLLAFDPDTTPLPAGVDLATVPGDDMFANLEAEIVADRVTASLAQRRSETRDLVDRLIRTVTVTQSDLADLAAAGEVPTGVPVATPVDAAPVDAVLVGAVDEVLEPEEAQCLLEWLNQMYVTLRTAELAANGVEAAVGQAQSGDVFLNLDGLTGDPNEPGEPASHDGVEADGLQMGMAPLLVAVMVEELSQALDLLPQAPAA